MTDILDTIDETLTYHSAGLGEDVTVAVEKPRPDLTAFVETLNVALTGGKGPAVDRSWLTTEEIRPHWAWPVELAFWGLVVAALAAFVDWLAR